MARTTAEIKKTMTDAFMENEDIRSLYDLNEGDAFADKFSNVSIENIIFFIVAACCHVLETLFDYYRAEIEDRIKASVVASVPWYHRMALAFQYGDSIILKDNYQWGYAETNESRQVVRYAAVRDRGTSVQILVSGDSDGQPVPLSNDVLTVFKHYMNSVKPAGIILNISSCASNSLSIAARITIDPLVLTTEGTSIADGTKPVENAITQYLKNIVYGGNFNKTRLVDAIQSVPGVNDVELGACRYLNTVTSEWTDITGNNYMGDGGSYMPHALSNTLQYVI